MIMKIINWVKKESIWDLLAWASLAMIFFWALAKSFGWINTPVIIEMLPLFGAVYWAGRMFQQMDDIKKDVRQLKKEMNMTRIDIHDLDKRLTGVEVRLSGVETRLSGVEARL